MNVFECAALTTPGIRHGFFGRQGGVSEGIFASLNCGFGSSDAAANVDANRARAAARLGVTPAQLITNYQIHSAEVVVVEEPWAHEARPKADAMVTRKAGIALGVLAADCAPILFADAEAHVVGAAHAGWKGALGGVAEATVAAMERLGAARARIAAAIGPCIAQASYEVGPEFRARFRDADATNDRYFAPSPKREHWQFDLTAYVAGRLAELELASVTAAGRCTYAEEAAYFSFRRATHRGEPDYGRNLSAIVLGP